MMSVGTSIAFKPLGDTRPPPEERASPVGCTCARVALRCSLVVARIERSEIRGRRFPRFASLNAGYELPRHEGKGAAVHFGETNPTAIFAKRSNDGCAKRTRLHSCRRVS